MYEKILNDPLVFGPEIGTEARSILTGLLTRDPKRRLGVNGAEEIRKHPFFGNHIDFKKLAQKKIHPPFKPSVASPVVREIYPSLCDNPLTCLVSGCVQLRHGVHHRGANRQRRRGFQLIEDCSRPILRYAFAVVWFRCSFITT